jgi:hypothetical protein
MVARVGGVASLPALLGPTARGSPTSYFRSPDASREVALTLPSTADAEAFAAMQEREITSRIRLDELLGLLDTEEPATKQRTTAPMPAVTLEQLLQPAEPPASTVEVTFRRPTRATQNVRPRALEGDRVPVRTAGAGAPDDFEQDEGSSTRHPPHREGNGDGRESTRITVRDTIRMAAEAAGILGTVNGVPILAVSGYNSAMIALGSNPGIKLPSSIDAAIDAAIETEIHNAEIDAAIDAVVRSPPATMAQQRYGIVAMSFALSFMAGIILMLLL